MKHFLTASFFFRLQNKYLSNLIHHNEPINPIMRYYHIDQIKTALPTKWSFPEHKTKTNARKWRHNFKKIARNHLHWASIQRFPYLMHPSGDEGGIREICMTSWVIQGLSGSGKSIWERSYRLVNKAFSCCGLCKSIGQNSVWRSAISSESRAFISIRF